MKDPVAVEMLFQWKGYFFFYSTANYYYKSIIINLQYINEVMDTTKNCASTGG